MTRGSAHEVNDYWKQAFWKALNIRKMIQTPVTTGRDRTAAEHAPACHVVHLGNAIGYVLVCSLIDINCAVAERGSHRYREMIKCH